MTTESVSWREQCEWRVAWGAQCGKRKAPDHKFCPEHRDLKCGCGRPATTDCGRVIGNFVCGAPKCAEYPQGPKCHKDHWG